LLKCVTSTIITEDRGTSVRNPLLLTGSEDIGHGNLKKLLRALFDIAPRQDKKKLESQISLKLPFSDKRMGAQVSCVLLV